MPVELHLSSERRAVRAFASFLAGFIERASARYQGTHHLGPDPPRVHEPRRRDGPSSAECPASSIKTVAPGAADAARSEALHDAGEAPQAAAPAVAVAGSHAQVLEPPPPPPRWGSRTITKILERRQRAEEGHGASWCQALPHDAVPGPLVAALLDEWLPARAVAATDAQMFAAADGLEIASPKAAAMRYIGRQKGAIHVDSLTIKMAGTELTYDTLRAAAVYLPQVTSLTISNAGPVPEKLGKHLCVFPCLKHLVLELCDVMDSHFLHVWGCEKLESVSVGATRYCRSVTHRKVGYIARCPALTSFHDERFDRTTSVQEVLDLLVQHRPGLTSLGLNCHSFVFTNTTHRATGTAISQLTMLRSLSLVGWKTTNALVPYLAHCRVLESIRFVDAHRLVSSGLAQLLELPALTSLGLIGVTLRDCSLETALAVPGTGPLALKALNVTGSWAAVTEAGIRAVLRCCLAVKHIIVKDCRLLDSGLEEETRAKGVTLTLG